MFDFNLLPRLFSVPSKFSNGYKSKVIKSPHTIQSVSLNSDNTPSKLNVIFFHYQSLRLLKRVSVFLPLLIFADLVLSVIPPEISGINNRLYAHNRREKNRYILNERNIYCPIKIVRFVIFVFKFVFVKYKFFSFIIKFIFVFIFVYQIF